MWPFKPKKQQQDQQGIGQHVASIRNSNPQEVYSNLPSAIAANAQGIANSANDMIRTISLIWTHLKSKYSTTDNRIAEELNGLTDEYVELATDARNIAGNIQVSLRFMLSVVKNEKMLFVDIANDAGLINSAEEARSFFANNKPKLVQISKDYRTMFEQHFKQGSDGMRTIQSGFPAILKKIYDVFAKYHNAYQRLEPGVVNANEIKFDEFKAKLSAGFKSYHQSARNLVANLEDFTRAHNAIMGPLVELRKSVVQAN